MGKQEVEKSKTEHSKSYSIKVNCENCGSCGIELEIEKGVLVSEGIKKGKCPACGCKGVIKQHESCQCSHPHTKIEYIYKTVVEKEYFPKRTYPNYPYVYPYVGDGTWWGSPQITCKAKEAKSVLQNFCSNVIDMDEKIGRKQIAGGSSYYAS